MNDFLKLTISRIFSIFIIKEWIIMANDSFNETMNALEKEKKTKQLANMLAAQEDISYDKAYIIMYA